MLAFERSHIAKETALLHPTLWTILRLIADGLWFEHTQQENVIVTQIFRTRAQTIAIYQAAGLTPPDSSVHESVKIAGDAMSGCRGCDLSVRMARPGMRYDEWSFLPSTRVRAFVDAVNATWRYQESEAHQVALYHSVSGPHVHLQVRPNDETKRRDS